MSIKRVLYSLGVSATFLSAAFLAVDYLSLPDKIMANQNANLNIQAFKNLAENINSFHDEKLNETTISEAEIKPNELVIASIEKELNREIYAAKKVYRNEYKAIAINTIKKVKPVTINKQIEKVKAKEIEQIEQADLSAFEINNNELVYLSAFSFEKVATVKFEIPTINEEIISDKVEVQVAATKKEEVPVAPIEPKTSEVAPAINDNENEDMVMFDYSDKKNEEVVTENKIEKKFDKKLYERPISDTVKNVIHREMGTVHKLDYETVETKKAVTTQKDETPNETLDETSALKILEKSEDQIVYDYSAPKREVAKSAFTQETTRADEVTIKTININLTNKKIQNGYSFEFEPDYDRNERVYDNNSGEIKFGYSHGEDVSLVSGAITQRGMVPVRTDIVMSTHQIIIPMFEEESYGQLLDSQGVETKNAILISKTNNLKDADIDVEYSKKIYLSKTFKVSDVNKDDTQFIMFLGVNPENVLLKYDVENTIAQTIVHVTEGEIYFAEPSFERGERESFELITRNLLSPKEIELNLTNNNVKVFNSEIYSKKVALNVYELKMPTQIFGTRKYLQINHDGNELFVGATKSQKIEIPSKEFIGKVLEFNQASMNSTDGRSAMEAEKCLIQLNLKNRIQDLKITGKNSTGEMFVETSYLDPQGNLTKENVEDAQKVFILGEQVGTVNIHLINENGTTQDLKSYCSSGTYLLEQL